MINAVYDNVIVKRVYKDTLKGGVIVLPDTHGLKSNLKEYYGEVVSVGPGCKHELKSGDWLIFPRNEGFKVIDKNGNEFYSLRERWQLAVVND